MRELRSTGESWISSAMRERHFPRPTRASHFSAFREPIWAACLEVTDKGPGIAKADQPHIFKRFYRTDQPKNRHGSGLGLYIAKGFVQAFGER